MTDISPDMSQFLPVAESDVRFEKPWHAEAFALAVAAHQAHLFPWKEWVQVFSGKSRSAQAGSSDQTETYYEDWLETLEHLLMGEGVVDEPEVDQRVEAWRQAYLNTPHGHPVLLLTGTEAGAECPAPPKAHLHGHASAKTFVDRPAPLFVSPAIQE